MTSLTEKDRENRSARMFRKEWNTQQNHIFLKKLKIIAFFKKLWSFEN